ncbi:MAG: hypothetical protein IKF99_01165 [Oscillospiraceae bacterium]|nr:hypothetical protein [Oscillospiraceae bacterium]
MNAVRRKGLKKIQEELNELQEQLSGLLEEEEDYRDNMPENLQGSERYYTAEAACDNMQEAIDNIEAAIESIEAAAE